MRLEIGAEIVVVSCANCYSSGVTFYDKAAIFEFNKFNASPENGYLEELINYPLRPLTSGDQYHLALHSNHDNIGYE
jgi:hypothetical protein